jgi:Ca2+-binding RTX toxin-like protein
VNITGNQLTTINALNADVTTVNASAMAAGGSLVMTARSGLTAGTITGTLGNDTLIMTSAGDTMTGGTGTDTLDVDFASVGGGLIIDLSNTVDQLTAFNGAIGNSAVQVGFENLDASGYATAAGVEVTARALGSTMIGSGQADIIKGGAAIDNITGGGAADTLTGGGGVDVFNFAVGDSNSTATDAIGDYATTEQLVVTGVVAVLNGSIVTSGVGRAALTTAGALAVFNAADDTLAERIIATAAGLDSAVAAVGESAHFTFGTDTFVMISDGVAGLTANDTLIKLTGVDATAAAFDVMTITGQNANLA